MKAISAQRIFSAKPESRQYLGIFLLRMFLGFRLLYGVIDNVLHWERMIEFSLFLENHEFPFPVLCAVVSVYVQFFGALSLLIGYKVRLLSFFLFINFVVAVVFVHFAVNDTVEGMTPALAMLFGSLTIFFTGAGRLSLDHFLGTREN